MTPKEYQSCAQVTANLSLNTESAIANYCMGLSGEYGEVLELLCSYNNPYAKSSKRYEIQKKLIYEIGDLYWYIAMLCTTCSIELEDIIAESKTDRYAKRSKYNNESIYLYQDLLGINISKVQEFFKKFIYHRREFDYGELLRLLTEVVTYINQITTEFRGYLSPEALLEDIFSKNIAKLRKRYPDKFSKEDQNKYIIRDYYQTD